MKTKAFLGALPGAIIGGLIWELTLLKTQFYLFFMPVLLGVLIALGVVLILRQRTINIGLTCMALTVGAFILGKIATGPTFYHMRSDIFCDALNTPEAYETMQMLSQAYGNSPGSKAAIRMMLTHPRQSPDEDSLGRPEYRVFVDQYLDEYDYFNAAKPTFEEWQAHVLSGTREQLKQINPLRKINASSSKSEIMFLVIGLMAAFMIGGGKNDYAQAEREEFMTGLGHTENLNNHEDLYPGTSNLSPGLEQYAGSNALPAPRPENAYALELNDETGADQDPTTAADESDRSSSQEELEPWQSQFITHTRPKRRSPSSQDTGQ
ncbi:hypothetical protein JXA32_13450 [Candidatus Sumerlaeota bacterium]|nr:hypothetical protein [Candidatus Sumerlaeota bacterium]